MRAISIVALFCLAAPALADVTIKPITLQKGTSAVYDMGYSLTRACKVVAAETCTKPSTNLGEFSDATKAVSVMGKTSSAKLAHCIDPISGGLADTRTENGRGDTASIYALRFLANGIYGYDQVTTRCTMQDGKTRRVTFKIRVSAPESEAN